MKATAEPVFRLHPPLANPCHTPAAVVAAAGRVGAFPLSPGRVDAAVLVSLAAGAWTIQVSGAEGGSGVVLIEAYDLGP